MLCEAKLLSMAYGEAEESCLPQPERQESPVGSSSRSTRSVVHLHHNPSEQEGAGRSPPEVSQLESLDLYRTQPGTENSMGIQIGSNQWRQGSGRDLSFLFQGREGPFTNSLLNGYLEQKILDLYQQYMMENMARNSGPVCPLLASEMVLTSLDQITLQLSRDGNLEAGVLKDMVMSCLLRVAGEMESSEISTPFLQISSDPSKEHVNQYKEQ